MADEGVEGWVLPGFAHAVDRFNHDSIIDCRSIVDSRSVDMVSSTIIQRITWKSQGTDTKKISDPMFEDLKVLF